MVAWHNDGSVTFTARTNGRLARHVVQVVGTMHIQDDRLVLQRLEFVTGGPGELTASVLRDIKLDDVINDVRRQAVKLAREQDRPEAEAVLAANPDLAASSRAIRAAGKAAAKNRPTGARGWGDDFYRMVATERLRLEQEGLGGRGVLDRLAERLAKLMEEPEPRHRDNVRDWVNEARNRKFLMRGQPGRATAEAGPNL